MNRDKTGEADGMNLEVNSKDEVMHISKLAICDFQTDGRTNQIEIDAKWNEWKWNKQTDA